MKFAQNRLYIEEYIKCANCGVLIYETRGNKKAESITQGGKIYCSQWCLDWEKAREARKAPAAAPKRAT